MSSEPEILKSEWSQSVEWVKNHDFFQKWVKLEWITRVNSSEIKCRTHSSDSWFWVWIYTRVGKRRGGSSRRVRGGPRRAAAAEVFENDSAAWKIIIKNNSDLKFIILKVVTPSFQNGWTLRFYVKILFIDRKNFKNIDFCSFF